MYVMSYFVAGDESLYFATSVDGHHWQALHGLNPVLTPTGEVVAIRDPFIRMGTDGRFHLLATNGWACTSIIHAVSDDLLDWHMLRLVPVMGEVPGARNAWAPEFFVDVGSGDHIVTWSSAVGGDAAAWADQSRVSTETMDQRIWCCMTRDLESWSAPRLWFDPGYTVIDATVTRRNGRWMMAFKDERGHNHSPTPYKGIRISGFDSSFGPFDPPSEIVSEALAEGPTFVERGSSTALLFDHFLDGRYGGAELRNGRWEQMTALSVPAGARHASVLQVDTTTFTNLIEVASRAVAGHQKPLTNTQREGG